MLFILVADVLLFYCHCTNAVPELAGLSAALSHDGDTIPIGSL